MKELIIEQQLLLKNIEKIKQIANGTRVIAVLKGNGYGIGLIPFATILQQQGIDFFAVSDILEAVLLRKHGFTCDILLLSPTCEIEEAREIVRYEITASIGSPISAEILNAAAKEVFSAAATLGEQSSEDVSDIFPTLASKVKAHIKIDTGFGRFGFLPSQVSQIPKIMSGCDMVEVCGTYSHFASSFSKNSDSVDKQLSVFSACLDKLSSMNFDCKMRHIANSCAFLRYPYAHLDAVRVGSAFLGRLPIDGHGLSRIAYMKSQVCEVKHLPKGSHIGYAQTCKTRRDTVIAIVPVGYSDGFGVEKSRDTFRTIDILRYMYNDIRNFGKKINVNIGGKSARILGRISMYNIVVDVTDLPSVAIGDTVALNINPILVDSSIVRKYIDGMPAKSKETCD